MTDLELTRRCAEAMGLSIQEIRDSAREYRNPGASLFITDGDEYDPLHDDAQAMELVRAFKLWISPLHSGKTRVETNEGGNLTDGSTINRAIVECVAKMQAAKTSA